MTSLVAQTDTLTSKKNMFKYCVPLWSTTGKGWEIPYGVEKKTSIFLKLHIVHITSSTAQGGGGSFKNRKPIGEVGCCESGMAERSH